MEICFCIHYASAGTKKINLETLSISQTLSISVPDRQSHPPFRNDPIFFWLYMLRSVLNRTRVWIKKISDFYFPSYHRKLTFFQKNDTKMVITRKIKIVEFWNLVLLSIQLIADILREKKFPRIFKIQIFYFYFEFCFLKILAIGWIESRNKFQNSSIFIFWVMAILVSFFWKNHPNFRW